MGELNKFWAEKIIDALIKSGIDYFCVSPGSRSTPLTMAIANHPLAKSMIFIDERGAAYHAVGYARGSSKPAVLVCTSGTAVANYLPAVVEANNDSIPFIVLSADRPPELQNIGANQTINQQDIFKPYIRYFRNFLPPENNNQIETKIKFISDSIELSHYGVVHLNCMFREPLYPDFRENIEETYSFTSELGNYSKISNHISDEDLHKVIEVINKAKSGLILLGRGYKFSDSDSMYKFIGKLKFPVLPDIQSGFRFDENPDIINYYDQLLNNDDIFNKKYDIIIQIGYGTTSKRLLNYLKDIELNKFLQFIETDKINDPETLITDRIQCDIEHFLSSALPYIKNKIDPGNYLLAQSNHNCDKQISEQTQDQLSEIAVSRSISELIPDRTGLFLASSMPIREMDMFAGINNKIISVGANRGASGIDGVISSAIGFAAGLNNTVTLLTGDLSFIHDMNAFLSLSQSDNQLIIILINNYGGGIFSFLPISKNNSNFDEYFSTPHDIKFDKISEQFGINYNNPNTLSEFKDNYTASIDLGKHAIIEVNTNREENYNQHQELAKKIIDSFGGLNND